MLPFTKEELHKHGGQDGMCHLVLSAGIPHPCSQFMECHVSVESDLGNESLRKKNHLCEHKSLLCVLLEIESLCLFMFSFVFLLSAHKGIDNE